MRQDTLKVPRIEVGEKPERPHCGGICSVQFPQERHRSKAQRHGFILVRYGENALHDCSFSGAWAVLSPGVAHQAVEHWLVERCEMHQPLRHFLFGLGNPVHDPRQRFDRRRQGRPVPLQPGNIPQGCPSCGVDRSGGGPWCRCGRRPWGGRGRRRGCGRRRRPWGWRSGRRLGSSGRRGRGCGSRRPRGWCSGGWPRRRCVQALPFRVRLCLGGQSVLIVRSLPRPLCPCRRLVDLVGLQQGRVRHLPSLFRGRRWRRDRRRRRGRRRPHHDWRCATISVEEIVEETLLVRDAAGDQERHDDEGHYGEKATTTLVRWFPGRAAGGRPAGVAARSRARGPAPPRHSVVRAIDARAVGRMAALVRFTFGHGPATAGGWGRSWSAVG